MLNQQITFDNTFANKMIINLEMLYFGMENRIGSKGNSIDIITMNDRRDM